MHLLCGCHLEAQNHAKSMFIWDTALICNNNVTSYTSESILWHSRIVFWLRVILHVGKGGIRNDKGKFIGRNDIWHAKKSCCHLVVQNFHFQTMLIKTTLDEEFCVATVGAPVFCFQFECRIMFVGKCHDEQQFFKFKFFLAKRRTKILLMRIISILIPLSWPT
jgi:hypothetical protein